MLETFTITAAARLLEKDRETLVRALRRVPPDTVAKTRGRDRDQWHMSTIVAALERNSGGRSDNNVDLSHVVHDWCNPNNWRSTLIADALIEYNKLFAEMRAIPDLKKRRAFAVKRLAPLIRFHSENFAKWEVDNPAPGKFDNGHDSVFARVDLLWDQQITATADACGWDHDTGRQRLYWDFVKDTD